MVSTSFMVDTSSHPRAQLHRCVERSAYGKDVGAQEYMQQEMRWRPDLAPPIRPIALRVMPVGST